MVKVSVIMPSLNVVEYIDECIKSVLEQDLREIEILCIDAGSTDGTKEKLIKYANIDNRMEIINSSQKSYGYQVNCGIKLAKGKYVTVVETDDYICPSMLSYLYEQAEKNRADIVKADHKNFWIDNKGDKIFYDWHLFDNNNRNLYYTCMNNAMLPNYIHLRDTYLWAAIYRRDFLLRNNICLNESPGAAYQDTGFMQQIHIFVERIMYSDEMLYYYRTDRNDSSVNRPGGLKNIYQEYEFIFCNHLSNMIDESMYKKYVANRIAYVYITELEKSIVYTNFDIYSVSWGEYYEKFKPVIRKFVDDYIISDRIFPNEYWIPLLLSISSLKSYRDYLKVKYDDIKRKKKILLEKCYNKSCIIFGSGSRGKRLYALLREYDINIDAFWDNNMNKWGSDYQGIPIVKPISISSNDRNVFVITVRGAEDIIARQLKSLGAIDANIVYFNW